MPFMLNVDIVDPDGEIYVTHQFWGETPEECEATKAKHLESCEYFAAAEREERTIEALLEPDERPEAEEDEDELDDD